MPILPNMFEVSIRTLTIGYLLFLFLTDNKEIANNLLVVV